jgi:uncharacterized protein
MPDRVPDPENYQTRYQRRWRHVQNTHVRSLAWLLDSPSLLNAAHPRWANALAQLPEMSQQVQTWLTDLDRAPQVLEEFLALHPHTRLGHYAENLLAFYFTWKSELVAHSVQVRSHTTIGEFDFLLTTPDGFEHWEFACKFYLFVEPATQLADYVGPNLMDNLNDKSHKIMDVQLALGRHPDAKKYLATPLHAAKALLKGWLFYHRDHMVSLPEVAADHCRGLWCRLSEFPVSAGDQFAILSRLTWLAPAKVGAGQILSRDGLVQHLTKQFVTDNRPVLVAQLCEDCGDWLESERLFVVPDDWNSTARQGPD